MAQKFEIGIPFTATTSVQTLLTVPYVNSFFLVNDGATAITYNIYGSPNGMKTGDKDSIGNSYSASEIAKNWEELESGSFTTNKSINVSIYPYRYFRLDVSTASGSSAGRFWTNTITKIFGLNNSRADIDYKGYFATSAALSAAFPTSTNGAYAIIGSTKTIWIWNDTTSAWSDTSVAPSPSTYIVGAVVAYADLPTVSDHTDELWLVKTTTGLLFSRKAKGLYLSDGSSWTWMSDYQILYDDTQTTFYDDGDNTKRAQFQLNGITPNNTRVLTFPDKDITIAGVDDVETLEQRFDTVASDTLFATGINNINTSDLLQRVNTTLSFNDSTHVFSIAPAGGSYTTFDVYLSGIKYTFNSAQTVDLDDFSLATDTQYFIYFHLNGSSCELTASTTPWEIDSNAAPIATLFWNGVKGFLGEERHGARRNIAYHKWAHKNIGTRWTSGLLGTFNADGTFSFATGQISDEDIVLNITGAVTTARVWYTTTGPKPTVNGDATVSAYVDTGVLKYNSLSSYTLEPVTSGYFVRNYFYGTNDIELPIAMIVGENEYSNIEDARNDPFPIAPTYINAEVRLLYTTIWANVGGTPTYVENTDYRTSPTQSNGTLAEIPVFLSGLEDVYVPTPQLDQVLRWNGLQWTNGAPVASSASSGIQFFNSSPTITGATTDNSNPILTLSKTPVTTAEQTQAATATNNTVLSAAWLYDTALGRTSIDAGTWNFNSYAYVNSVIGGRVTYMQRGIYSVLPQDGGSITVTFTGTGTTRTVTASGGTPFATTKIDASATNTIASYIQTPNGLYQITARTSDTVVSVTTLTTYTNESAVTFNVWKRLFIASSPTVTATSLATIGTYTWSSVQAAFTITALHKFGAISFVTSNNTTTLTTTYDGTTHNTHFDTPLITLHNNLAGLQGGTTGEMYHLTQAQATVVANTSGTNTGDVTLAATNNGLSLTNQVLALGTPSTLTNATTNAVTGSSHTHAVEIDYLGLQIFS